MQWEPCWAWTKNAFNEGFFFFGPGIDLFSRPEAASGHRAWPP